MNPKTKQQFENILMFAKRVQERMKNISLETFSTDEYLQDAVLFCIGHIGETAKKIPNEEQEKYPQLFWKMMIGLRNRLFHDYYEIDLSKIYEITQEPISQLIKMLESILD